MLRHNALLPRVTTCRRINNAGSNGYKYGVLGEYTDAELINIVETNVLGVMLGCREVSAIYMFVLLPKSCFMPSASASGIIRLYTGDWRAWSAQLRSAHFGLAYRGLHRRLSRFIVQC